MKKLALCSLVLVLTAFGQPARGELCTLDVVPAATLLLPYFEVDISSATGVNTIFYLNNISSEPVLAHVVLWTDWSFITLNFNVFLSGYDVVPIDLYQIIALGKLPMTEDDGSFPGCQGVFPPPDVTGGDLDRLQNGHAGYPVPTLGGDCVGEELNAAGGSCSGGTCTDGTIARGYVTIDNVSVCSDVVPLDPFGGYFGTDAVASDDNLLWGDFFYYDQVNLATHPLVHVEADASLEIGAGGPNSATGYTFYGRYTSAAGGIDHREPLGTAWGARYGNGFSIWTDYVVWRDTTDDQSVNNDGWTCGNCVSGAGPDWCPLAQTEVICFDEMENAVELCVAEPCFPLESQRIPTVELEIPFDFGWCFLDLNHSFGTVPAFGGLAQSYFMELFVSEVGFQSTLPSALLGHACRTSGPIVDPPGLVFDDGFETGDTSGWSQAFP